MNICLMNDSFPPIIDGVANAVFNYAEIITRDHGNAVVATPQYPGAVDEYPFPVVRYPSVDTTKKLGYRAGYPFAPETLGTLAEKKPDIIHSHCPMVSTILARLLRDNVGAPVIMTYHTKFDIDIAKVIEGKLVREAAIKLLVDNVSACDEVWVVSRGAGENLRSIGYEGDYIVMENGVDLPKGRVAEDECCALSRQYSLPEDVPIFLFVGRMMWYKGIGLILDAMAELKAGGRDFRMVFIGDGGDRDKAVKTAEALGLTEKCVFAGSISDRETIRAWYCRASLLLFPSTFDTNGLVVREAAACGLGSLLIAKSCAAEGIIDGRTGILVSESGSSIAAKLTDLMDKPQAMRNIGQGAMDEIYVSWDVGVNRAWERYQVVYDRFKSRGGTRKRMPTDDILSVMGELLEGLDKVRLPKPEKLSGLRQLKGHLDRYI